MRLVRPILRSSVLLLALCAVPVLAQNFRSAARQLRHRILSVTGPRPRIELSFENRSSLGVAEAADFRREIEAELRFGGAKLVAGGKGASAVDVTLSESWRKLLLVAEVTKGKASRVVMVSLLRKNGAAAAGTGERVVSLARRIVWRQRHAFLAFLPWKSPAGRSYLWILAPGRLRLYRQEHGQWRWRGTGYIPHAGAWPRDTRGMLWSEPLRSHRKAGDEPADRLRTFLPGVACEMPLVAAIGRLPLVCRPPASNGRDFPIFQAGSVAGFASLAPERNFFRATIDRAGASVALQPFYAATFVHNDHGAPVLVATALDGKTYLYSEAGKPEGSVEGWGSEVAGVETDCGGGWQVLATRPGDWTANDSLAAYEIVDSKAVETGEPIDFPGPVLSLRPEPDGAGAQAVVLDRSAGFYEAYTVTLSCSR